MSNSWWMMSAHPGMTSNKDELLLGVESNYLKFEQKHQVFTALHIAI